MTLALDRIEIESVGADPVRLAAALFRQLPGLDGAVPIEEIALALDIESIEVRPLMSIEGCLQCDPLKSRGQIVVNALGPRRRRRYSVAHELGHFLNERHRPTIAFGFDCTAEDMSLPQRSGQRQRQEREANTFAIEVLTPRHLLARHLKPAAELDHALGMAERFDISREAASRRYVALHQECLAAVFSQDGRIRYIERGEGFPRTSVWTGDPLPRGPTRPGGGNLTNLGEVHPAAWLDRPNRYALFAQTLFQDEGFAITLLVAEFSDDAAESGWEPSRFRR